ncbi:MAG: sigma 54-interacting transcriptional regulator [Desulfobacterales bacterium]|nr:sigma 54-interacting transcriptional regulator [Desulfobacterales bacterium]
MENQTQIILDSIADGVFTVDLEWKITSFNRAAERITGIRRQAAIGQYCWEVFRASICAQHCSLRKTMQTGQSIAGQTLFIANAGGSRVPVSITTALLKDPSGEIIGGVETFRDLSEVENLRKELTGRKSFFDIISKNKEMKRLFGMLEMISGSDTTVLIEGESGSGKELFAKAIHSLSHRSTGPLTIINCAAVPDTLLESELFGYKAGAFTDAKKDKPGRVALARGGTLFLDEIGDLSPLLQVKMLRLLQEKVYEPLGGTRSEKADIRIVAATNRNLTQMVKDGSFRQDLFYRINVARLSLPPLRSRKEDIPLLTDHFIKKYNHLNGSEIEAISPAALSVLMAHEFPGNVRELENIVEYASLICREKQLGIVHLPDYLREASERPSLLAMDEGFENTPRDFRALERQLIYETLREFNGNRSRSAARLGIHPTTLWRRMKRLNIHPPANPV